MLDVTVATATRASSSESAAKASVTEATGYWVISTKQNAANEIFSSHSINQTGGVQLAYELYSDKFATLSGDDLWNKDASSSRKKLERLEKIASERIRLLAASALRKSEIFEYNARLLALNEEMNILSPHVSPEAIARLGEIEDRMAHTDAVLKNIESFLAD